MNTTLADVHCFHIILHEVVASLVPVAGGLALEPSWNPLTTRRDDHFSRNDWGTPCTHSWGYEVLVSSTELSFNIAKPAQIPKACWNRLQIYLNIRTNRIIRNQDVQQFNRLHLFLLALSCLYSDSFPFKGVELWCQVGFSAAVATNIIECVQNVFSKRWSGRSAAERKETNNYI